MNTISTVTILPFTKEEQTTFIHKFVDEFNNLPENEQQKLYIHLKSVINTLSEIVGHDDVRGAIISRMEDKKIQTSIGEIIYCERKSYSFKHCPRWSALYDDMKILESKMKAIEAPVADIDTGEIIHPATKNVIEVLKVNFK